MKKHTTPLRKNTKQVKQKANNQQFENKKIKHKTKTVSDAGDLISLVMNHAIEWGCDPGWLQAENAKRVRQEEKQMQEGIGLEVLILARVL